MSNLFSNIRNAVQLFKSIDFDELSKISEKVDLSKMMEGFSKMDDKQLKNLMKFINLQNEKRTSTN